YLDSLFDFIEKTINSKDLSGFYFVTLVKNGVSGTWQTGFTSNGNTFLCDL
ncbi:MAG: hypothetical protein JWO32_1173, partial [Bacteroidetes bacterium]|nr:hypothetical protein [Bacteroidota bacterium]